MILRFGEAKISNRSGMGGVGSGAEIELCGVAVIVVPGESAVEVSKLPARAGGLP